MTIGKEALRLAAVGCAMWATFQLAYNAAEKKVYSDRALLAAEIAKRAFAACYEKDREKLAEEILTKPTRATEKERLWAKMVTSEAAYIKHVYIDYLRLLAKGLKTGLPKDITVIGWHEIRAERLNGVAISAAASMELPVSFMRCSSGQTLLVKSTKEVDVYSIKIGDEEDLLNISDVREKVIQEQGEEKLS